MSRAMTSIDHALRGCARGLLAFTLSMLAAGPLLAREAASEPVDVLVRDVTLIDVVDGKRHAHRDLALPGPARRHAAL